MFERINFLVAKRGFTLKVWEDRYSKGVWAVCTPVPYDGDAIYEASEDGDIAMSAATDYVLSTEWLPVVTGPSVIEALTKLEERLGRVNTNCVLIDQM